MKYLVSVEQMTAAELISEEKGISRVKLMRNAAESILNFLKNKFPDISEKTVAIICGSGNNGGDGAALACLLLREKIEVRLVFPGRFPDTETARECLKEFGELDLNSVREDKPEAAFEKADIIIDCVFGTGFHGELPETAAKIFGLAAQTEAVKISVDIPSGVNGNTGVIAKNSFKPDITLVLGAMKTGLINLPCNDFCGSTEVLDIGIGDDCYKEYDGLFTQADIKKALPVRPRSSNKGTFGKLLNIAGCDKYIGAALLSSKAALRCGTGLVALASTEKVIPIAAGYIPECVFIALPADEEGFPVEASAEMLAPTLNNFSAVSMGCGMGNGKSTKKIAEFLLKNGKAPLILDADGINSISDNINVLKDKSRPVILTPHPAEFGRLTGLTAAEVQSDRLNLARSFAAEYDAVLLLKGADTVIAAPDGRVRINTTGGTALAKAGCGDVLTGIIGGLAAQGVEPFTAAVLGAYLHGEAADFLVREQAAASVLAGEVADALGKVINVL